MKKIMSLFQRNYDGDRAEVKTCKHNHFGGPCPSCLEEEIERLRTVLKEWIASQDDVKRIIKSIYEERDRQDIQWGGPQHDDEHSRLEWTEYINKQINRADNLAADSPEWRLRMVKVAALAIAAIESHDRIEQNR